MTTPRNVQSSRPKRRSIRAKAQQPKAVNRWTLYDSRGDLVDASLIFDDKEEATFNRKLGEVIVEVEIRPVKGGRGKKR